MSTLAIILHLECQEVLLLLQLMRMRKYCALCNTRCGKLQHSLLLLPRLIVLRVVLCCGYICTFTYAAYKGVDVVFITPIARTVEVNRTSIDGFNGPAAIKQKRTICVSFLQIVYQVRTGYRVMMLKTARGSSNSSVMHDGSTVFVYVPRVQIVRTVIILCEYCSCVSFLYLEISTSETQ